MASNGTAKQWAPSWLGQHLTRSPDWRLRLEGLELALALEGRSYRVNVEDEGAYRVSIGTFWTDVTLHPGQGREVKADGLPNAHGAALVQALDVALTEKRMREEVAALKGEQRTIDGWLDHKAGQERSSAEQRRWFTHEEQSAVLAVRPTVDPMALRARLKKPGVALRFGIEVRSFERSLDAWDADHLSGWAALNAAHLGRELVACKSLLDRAERNPLTADQARAVLCFDNRVQVVAAAGSGKTSTMVAKAAYAIHRGFVDPKRIILLAFNKQAAEELKARTAQALERLGMQDVTVETSTFHALGLRLIGKATGEKPDIPDWATDPAGGVRKLTEIVDQLKDRSVTFRRQWDLFRFVFGRNLPAFGSPEPADVWDAQGKGALVTTRGERVKSMEELMIANLLFLNGVNYRYEDPYPHRTADELHRQYKPDFYYPDLDLFHEHFALDANGAPPMNFEGYLEGVIWKRQLHTEKGTALIETTSHGLRQGDDLRRLEHELTARGLVLDPNPDREIPKQGQKPMEVNELIGLMRTFMSHAKSNGLSISDLQRRLDAMPAATFKLRHQMFLDIASPVMLAWDEALAEEDGIDFEDMLNLAADHLEGHRVESPYDLVMADEFQDASRARARLCRALVQGKGRFFFAVGDDWQSINRFAGADVSVMTGFREFFGDGQVLKLEQTFRCPQALCDVSSAFVSKNPAQIAKRVQSTTLARGPVLQAFQVDSKDQLADAIDRFLVKLAEGVRDGTIPPGRNGKVSVYVLGRYNADRQYVPLKPSRFSRWVDLSFLTIHRSKGSEADYVILPEMISAQRRRSFPNTRTDDPVLALAMPDGDTFPLGEERRLFYVALTRARRSVAMFTAMGQCSTFLQELEADGAVVLTDVEGNAVVREEACPACTQGVLVVRTGPYGEFRSCSNFPLCSYKPNQRASFSSPLPLERPESAASDELVRAPSASALLRSVSGQNGRQALRLSDLLQSAPPPPEPKKPEESLLSKGNHTLEKLSHSIEQAHQVQSVTAELSGSLDAERTVLSAALQLAHQSVQLEKELATKGPGYRAIFEESRAELEGLLTADPKDKQAPIQRHPLPNFERIASHSDPGIRRAMAAKRDELSADRAAFLSMTHAQLASDPALLAAFESELRDLGGEHYWATLDPSGALRGRT